MIQSWFPSRSPLNISFARRNPTRKGLILSPTARKRLIPSRYQTYAKLSVLGLRGATCDRSGGCRAAHEEIVKITW